MTGHLKCTNTSYGMSCRKYNIVDAIIDISRLFGQLCQYLGIPVDTVQTVIKVLAIFSLIIFLYSFMRIYIKMIMFDQEKYMKSSEAKEYKKQLTNKYCKLKRYKYLFIDNGNKMLQKEAEDYANDKLAIFNSFGEVVEREKLSDSFLLFVIQILFLWIFYNNVVYSE